MRTATLWLATVALLMTGVNGVCFARGSDVEVISAELAAPVPAFPFYRVVLHLRLPKASAISAQVLVDGSTDRFPQVYSQSRYESIPTSSPAIYDRPPSGQQLAQDETRYTTPYVVSWLRWAPGETYRVQVHVELRGGAGAETVESVHTASVRVTAPKGAPVYSTAWRQYQAIVVTNNSNMPRTDSPIELTVPFYAEDARNIRNAARVVEVDPTTHRLTGVPSQVFNVLTDHQTDELRSQRGQPPRTIPLFYPTTSIRLAFDATVPPRSSRVYLLFYDNPGAQAPEYHTSLHAKGFINNGMTISNGVFTAVMHKGSGALDRMWLDGMPGRAVYNMAETNGSIQWTPDIYAPPVPWTHTSDWIDPFTQSIVGPLLVKNTSFGAIRNYPGVEAAIKYWFYPNKDYFVFSSTIRIKQPISTVALRNGEMVFNRKLFDRVAWPNPVSGRVEVDDLDSLPTLAELRMPANVPWVTFYNSKTGVGFGGVQLAYSNNGLEHSPRLLDPHMYVTVGPWVYWGRPLSASYLSANPQQMIPTLAGNTFYERWAYTMYKFGSSTTPYEAVADLAERLREPLLVRLVQPVGQRVPDRINELMTGKEVWERGQVGK